MAGRLTRVASWSGVAQPPWLRAAAAIAERSSLAAPTNAGSVRLAGLVSSPQRFAAPGWTYERPTRNTGQDRVAALKLGDALGAHRVRGPALPSCATMQEFTCAEVASCGRCACWPWRHCLLLAVEQHQWNAQYSDSVCGAASASLLQSLLSYCD